MVWEKVLKKHQREKSPLYILTDLSQLLVVAAAGLSSGHYVPLPAYPIATPQAKSAYHTGRKPLGLLYNFPGT
jgi:hypothetical protein